MAVPTVVGFVTHNIGSSETTFTLTPDGTIANGDWMFALIGDVSNVTDNLTATGWTRIVDAVKTGTMAYSVFAKERLNGETGYSFSYPASRLNNAALLWVRGVDDISHWVIGALENRSTILPPTTFDNEAPSVTTTSDNNLILGFSFERTTAAETDTTSITNATEVLFAAENGTSTTTIAVAKTTQTIAGITPVITWVYPNTQATNGAAMQVALPPHIAMVTGTRVGIWDGATEKTAYLTTWNGSAENVPSLDTNIGIGPTVPQLFAGSQTVSVAHRGGSANWPEMTARAYKESAVIWDINAIEISVQKSSDGVFVASHDTTTTRVTGQNYTISSTPWSTLASLTATAAATDNISQPREPLAKLTDILDLYGGKRVIFIEDKTYANQVAILNLMDSYGGSNWFVWKQDGTGTVYSGAVSRGYKTWGYIFDSGMGSFASKQAQWTYIGLDYNSSNATLTSAIATAGANRVVAHIIPSVVQRDRLLGMGVRGLMIANVRDCLPKF